MPLFDKKDKSRYATFTRRTVGMGGGMATVFAILAGRLYQLQIRDGDQYMVEAEDNRISERLIVPPRGRIIDRFGTELANNRRNYRVLLVSEQATEGVRKALDNISRLIVLSVPAGSRSTAGSTGPTSDSAAPFANLVTPIARELAATR